MAVRVSRARKFQHAVWIAFDHSKNLSAKRIFLPIRKTQRHYDRNFFCKRQFDGSFSSPMYGRHFVVSRHVVRVSRFLPFRVCHFLTVALFLFATKKATCRETTLSRKIDLRILLKCTFIINDLDAWITAWHARGQRFDPAYLHQSTIPSSPATSKEPA